MAQEIILKDVRIAFPDIWEPRAFQGEGQVRYSAQFPIQPGSANETALDAAMLAAATQKWEARAKDVLADLVSRDKVCFVKRQKLNKKGEPVNGFESMWALSASADPAKGQKPLVVNRNLQPVGKTDGVIYAGCRVDVKLSLWAQDSPKWGRRVNAQLLVVQFRADADAFGGGAVASVGGMEDLSDLGEPGDLADLMG